MNQLFISWLTGPINSSPLTSSCLKLRSLGIPVSPPPPIPLPVRSSCMLTPPLKYTHLLAFMAKFSLLQNQSRLALPPRSLHWVQLYPYAGGHLACVTKLTTLVTRYYGHCMHAPVCCEFPEHRAVLVFAYPVRSTEICIQWALGRGYKDVPNRKKPQHQIHLLGLLAVMIIGSKKI